MILGFTTTQSMDQTHICRPNFMECTVVWWMSVMSSYFDAYGFYPNVFRQMKHKITDPNRTQICEIENSPVNEIKVLSVKRNPGQMLGLVTHIVNVKRFALNLFTGSEILDFFSSINIDNLSFC